MSSLTDADRKRLTPEAYLGPLESIGWQDLGHDDPAVCQLREHLIANAGIPDIELVDPAVPGYAARAAFLLERDGFVVVKDVLDTHRLSTIRRGAEMAIREMVGRDEMRVGNRGSHRYSFGSAPASFGFQDYWSVLIDPPVLMEVMEAIFGTKDFVTNSGSGGGDYNVPGSVEYQNLHSDSGGLPNSQYHDTKLEYLPEGQVFGPWPNGNRRRVDVDAPEDPANTYEIVNGRDVPAREHSVTVNYPFEVRADSAVGHTAYNGATRQIPGTASLDVRNGNPLPSLEEEPTWMKMSTTQPCPAGSAMIRDDRAWHGGTPNLGEYVRAIPHPGSYMLPTHPNAPTAEQRRVSLPYEIYEGMTEMGKHICRHIVAEKGTQVPPVTWGESWPTQEEYAAEHGSGDRQSVKTTLQIVDAKL